MDLIVTIDQNALHGEAGALAVEAAKRFFAAAGVAPEAAARAAWEIEGALEEDADYEVDEEACRLADLWAQAPIAVAEAAGLRGAVDVVLLKPR